MMKSRERQRWNREVLSPDFKDSSWPNFVPSGMQRDYQPHSESTASISHAPQWFLANYFFSPFLHSYWWKWRESETGAGTCACTCSNTHIYSRANAPVHPVHTITTRISHSCMYLNPHIYTVLCFVWCVISRVVVIVFFFSCFDFRYLCHWLCRLLKNLHSQVPLKAASLHKAQWRMKMWKRARAGPCPMEVYKWTL